METANGSTEQHPEMGRHHISLQLNAFIWFDRRDNVWRGLARELSLFAEGQSPTQVEQTLQQLCEDYVADAIEHDLVAEMIPRPVRRTEWLKLMAYGMWLSLEARISNLTHPGRDSDHPVRHRMIPC